MKTRTRTVAAFLPSPNIARRSRGMRSFRQPPLHTALRNSMRVSANRRCTLLSGELGWTRARRALPFVMRTSHRTSHAASVSRGVRGYEQTLERNWSDNVRFGAAQVQVPRSLAELQVSVKDAAVPCRVVGRGHSFSPVAECGGGTLLSLHRLNQILDFEAPAAGGLGSITIQGGTTYTEIASFLNGRGALRNLPSCPQFTVAGAIATGTHGSGVHIQSLACDVSMIEFVRADGSLVSYSREESPEILEGARVHLGCLGVVSRLTLDVVPYYDVTRYAYVGVPLEPIVASLPRLWTTCDSLSMWTSGFGTGPGAGKCWLQFRHFHPHYDPAVAVPKHPNPNPNLTPTPTPTLTR